jgi:alpha-glucosidase (family GH31 glycosyl hydrolase)
MSIMRVHSTLNDLPHFPFLYPKDKANAMRSALQLRYQLLPHMYSLAHVQYTQGLPMARPLFMEFPGDLSVVNTVRICPLDPWLTTLNNCQNRSTNGCPAMP